MGTIYKRSQTYWLKYYRNGKPYYESTGSQKETEAKKLLKKREGEISEGKLPGIYFDRVRFDELAEDLITDYEINNRKSQGRIAQSISHLTNVFGGVRVTNIDTPRIQGYIQERIDEGAANGTINRELAALKRMLNIGARQTPPKVDRVPYIPMLKENNVRKGFFEHGDYLALKDALPDYLKSLVTFAYKTGWRVSEIRNLTWSQVDREQGIVRIEPGEAKNNEGRTVYLDEELKEVFNHQWELRKKSQNLIPYVFPNRDGNDKVRRFNKAWDKACQDAGIGRKLFHDCRRTAIRNMVRAGIPERVAMRVSGHRTRAVFERYNIVNDTDLKLAAQRQEAYLKAQKVTKRLQIGNFGTKEQSSNND
jgi:integrase